MLKRFAKAAERQQPVELDFDLMGTGEGQPLASRYDGRQRF